MAELLEQLTDQRMSADGSVRRAFPSPDVIEARLHGHPHADRLRSLLPTLQILASLNDASALTQRREEREAAERAASQSEIGGTTNTPQLELGEFSLLRVIGRGGMGIVYEAEQRSLRRRVAVKILPLAGLLDDRLLKRFHIEAQAAACLTHENIVPIYCVGCDRDIHYYAMQFIDGDSLADVIAARKSKAFKRENGYPQVTTGLRYYQWVAELGFAAARALHYAHEAGVVHRDIKPSNLLLDKSGKLWITDFGLARIEGDGSVTMMGDCLGTLRYMSPEQVLGNPLLVDHRTDVYSLGATLYELLTLEPAVAGKREEIQCRLRVDEPRRPRQFIRDLPHDLETIVLKALADNRSERYATAGEMAADFARFLSHQTIAARRPTYFQRLAKWSRRNRTLAMSLGASLLLLMIGASVAAWFIGEAQDNVLLERQKRKHQEQLARIAQRSIVEQAYASGINIAAHAAQRNAFDGMEEALGRLIPGNSERDVRSFEWYYLAKLARSRPQLLARHEGEAYCVRFSPDGRRLATSGAGGVRIWRWPMMKCERHLSDSTADVNAVAWSPDGHVLVAMSDDKKARVYASPRWNLVKTLDFAGPLVAASFTAGGELLVIGERKIEVEHQVYGENRVHVFETRDWARRAELAATAETLRGMSVSAKGAFIAAAGHTGEIVIWDLETLRELHRFDAGVPLTTVAFAREQPIFVAGGSGSSLLTFDAASGERIGELPGIAHAQEDIAFVPSDDAVLSVGRNGTAYVWERERPTSWRLAVTFAHPHPLWSLAVHADGTLITTDRFGNIWGSNRFAPRDRRRLTSEMAHLAAGTVGSRESIYTSLAWSPDAHELAIAGYPGEVTFWDGATLRPIEVHSTDRLHIRCLAYAPNGRHLAMATYQGLICLCERKPFRILKRIQASQVQCLAFSSDGASLFAYAGNSEVPLSAFALPTLERAMDRVPRSCQGDIWWIPSNSYSFEFLLMPRESFDVNLLPRHTLNYCISGNRRTLVGHRGDDSYHVFAGPNWRPQGSFTGSQTDMALSPDGRTLAAVENYERIHLFSIATGRELMTLEPHLHGCHDIGFSPDGQRLLAVGEGLRHRGEIVVWDTADGQSERVSAR